ncbi:hypothetical protein PH210_17595 [Paenibacillus sp. BSR1-1]|uniref:hypothetical protein n=1 Tax=Paenibacillus sp. BSR1-1 TaxID=3020845 RepID=UPI0025AFA09E|nr:hypothetical protein [Paenibacillus sp. BSR1-1]MDN3018012.1 hypothetical protein [Paenibacillus sp. BSR1-1]
MKKKISLLLSGSILSAMLLGLTGCNTNTKNDMNPPPPTNNRIDNDLDNDGVNDRYENNLNNRNNNLNNRNNDLNDNNVIDRNHFPESEDKNTPTDKDPGKDNNTPREEIIEDDIDRHDADNKDE